MFQWYSTHDPGAASTVHSYYGSGIANLPWGQLSDWLIGTICYFHPHHHGDGNNSDGKAGSERQKSPETTLDTQDVCTFIDFTC